MNVLALLLASLGPTASFDFVAYQGSDPVDRAVSAGPGEYRNPVLQGFYPDPSIEAVGGDYYLVTSTFSYFPGLPVFHSRDLVNWRQIGNAIDLPDQVDFGTLGMSRGLFAPSIHHFDGTFYIANTCVDCGGNFVITADDPAGPWSDPHWQPDLQGGIDPSLFVDDDGQAYILNNGPPEGEPRYEGHRAIWIQRFDLQTMQSFGPRKVLIDGGINPEEKPIWIEGPQMWRKDGWLYLSCAEGGTAKEHSQVILRGRDPMGPFEIGPDNPILTQRDLPDARPYPVWAAGHADMVQTPEGDWWATFLGIRPYAPGLANVGRETFLLPVRWEDGWPTILPPETAIEPVVAKSVLVPGDAAPQAGAFGWREEFDGAPGPEWMMMRLPQGEWMHVANGQLHLQARDARLGDFANPSFLARRQQHAYAQMTTRVSIEGSGRAGLAALQNDEYWLAIGVIRNGDDQRVAIWRRAGDDDPAGGTMIASAPVVGGPVDLALSISAGTAAFRFSQGGSDWSLLADNIDATILSTQKAGGFVGTVLGPFAQQED